MDRAIPATPPQRTGTVKPDTGQNHNEKGKNPSRMTEARFLAYLVVAGFTLANFIPTG